MDLTITQLIMQENKIAYAIADHSLKVVWAGGAPGVLQDGEIVLGCSLPELVPEFVGSEATLDEVLSGQMPRFQLEQVNRTAPDGSTRYLTLTVLPCRECCPSAALLVVAADASEQGRYTQTMVQQRNEMALLQRRLAEANTQLDFLLHCYVPPEVATALMERRLLPQLGGELREVSILFADLRGYTGIAERLSPARVMELLNGYLGVAGDAIAEAGGTITQFMGDALLALFNAPNDQPDHSWRAVRAGLTLQKKIEGYRERASFNLPPLHFGVGINSGPALIGNTGAHSLYHYTAIGDTVNVASRICSAAQADEVLIGPGTREQLGPRVVAESLPPMHFKGKSHPVPVYCVDTLCDG